ncbi:DUF4365 domain-containing protein [Enterobacter kobei]|uniref:DUF4365 domain-containing protein n=2 Tax=Enterobacter kobei TaxID=208224 RepID=UPI002FD19440
MTSEANRIGSLGISHAKTVFTQWGWAFESISQENDDGFDGLVYIRSKKTAPKDPENRSKHSWVFTGGMIHVQVKTGESYISSRNKNEIKLKIQNLDEKLKIWKSSPIPCILIYVGLDSNDIPIHSYWTDLKSADTYPEGTTSIINVPLKNRIGRSPECKGPLWRLARGSINSYIKPLLDLTQNDSLDGILPLTLKGPLSTPTKIKAIDFFQKWKKIGAINPYFGPVLINRTGWSHITRKGRPLGRIESSFNLLPIAARIINDISTWRMLTPMRRYENRKDGYISITDFIGLTAKVIVRVRQSTEVMVILKRETKFKADEGESNAITRVWFYTVYEPGRGK